MANSKWLLAPVVGCAVAAAAPLSAANETRAAPPGTAETRYCMRVTFTGSLIERVKCWTRAQWAEQGVDLDKDGPREGVRVID